MHMYFMLVISKGKYGLIHPKLVVDKLKKEKIIAFSQDVSVLFLYVQDIYYF